MDLMVDDVKSLTRESARPAPSTRQRDVEGRSICPPPTPCTGRVPVFRTGKRDPEVLSDSSPDLRPRVIPTIPGPQALVLRGPDHQTSSVRGPRTNRSSSPAPSFPPICAPHTRWGSWGRATVLASLSLSAVEVLPAPGGGVPVRDTRRRGTIHHAGGSRVPNGLFCGVRGPSRGPVHPGDAGSLTWGGFGAAGLEERLPAATPYRRARDSGPPTCPTSRPAPPTPFLQRVHAHRLLRRVSGTSSIAPTTPEASLVKEGAGSSPSADRFVQVRQGSGSSPPRPTSPSHRPPVSPLRVPPGHRP